MKRAALAIILVNLAASAMAAERQKGLYPPYSDYAPGSSPVTTAQPACGSGNGLYTPYSDYAPAPSSHLPPCPPSQSHGYPPYSDYVPAAPAARELERTAGADLGGTALAKAVSLAPVPATRAFEMYCGGGKLQLQFKGAARFTAIVNDAAVTSALKTAAAKFYEGEQRLVNVRFTGPSSFMVADFQKDPDGYGYDAGQFAPKIRLLGGGRALLVLTYFRMNNSHSYDYNEVASFEFNGCIK